MPNQPDISTIRQEIAKKGGVEAPKVEAAAAVIKQQFEQKGGHGTLEEMKKGAPTGLIDARRDAAIKGNVLEGPNKLKNQTDAKNGIDFGNRYVKEYNNLGSLEQLKYQDAVAGQLASVEWMSDIMSSIPNQKDQRALADSLLKDPHFNSIVNKNLLDIATHRENDESRKALEAKIKAANPSMSDADISKSAASQLESDWLARTQNVLQDSVNDYLNENIDAAIEVTTNKTGSIDDELARVAAEKGKVAEEHVGKAFQDKWSREGAYKRRRGIGKAGVGSDGVVIQDFGKFMEGGLEGLFDNPPTAEQQLILSDPSLKRKYENQFGEQVLFNFMNTGKKLPQDTVRALMNAPWLGADPSARIDRLSTIVTSHDKVKKFMEQGVANGLIDKGWQSNLMNMDNVKKAGTLAAILAAIALPVVGGSAVLGTAAYLGKATIR